MTASETMISAARPRMIVNTQVTPSPSENAAPEFRVR